MSRAAYVLNDPNLILLSKPRPEFFGYEALADAPKKSEDPIRVVHNSDMHLIEGKSR